MSACRRSRIRVVLAILAVAELCLVTVSPLWHQDHHDLGAMGVSADHTPVDVHVCSTGDHASEGNGTCPICLSHRLLTHGLTAQAALPPAPAASHLIRLVRDSITSAARSEAILPRGPPAA